MKASTIFAAVFATPIVAMLYALSLSIWAIITSDAATLPSVIFATPGIALLITANVGVMLGWPIMLVAGLPAHWLLYRLRWHAVWHYVLTGMTVGAACVFLFSKGPESGRYLYWSIATLPGALAGLAFWLIRRPDRDAVSASPTP